MYRFIFTPFRLALGVFSLFWESRLPKTCNREIPRQEDGALVVELSRDDWREQLARLEEIG